VNTKRTHSRKQALIYGAGMAGKRAFNSYKGIFTIIGFVDTDKQKQGAAKMYGLPIYPPEKSLDVDYDVMLVATWSLSSVRDFYSHSPEASSKLLIVPKSIREGSNFRGKVIFFLVSSYLLTPLVLIVIVWSQ
jgi:FlaA1/EpsC-like NDP-sugar epimerase